MDIFLHWMAWMAFLLAAVFFPAWMAWMVFLLDAVFFSSIDYRSCLLRLLQPAIMLWAFLLVITFDYS